MCLIFLHFSKKCCEKSSKYILIFAANRDEVFHRPSKDAGFWEEAPHLLGGNVAIIFALHVQVLKIKTTLAIFGLFYKGPKLQCPNVMHHGVRVSLSSGLGFEKVL